MLRIYQGLTIVPLKNPMGGLHCRRVVIGDVTLYLFAPLPPLRFMRIEEFLHAGHLLG